MKVKGSITVSRPTFASAETQVESGSRMVTPDSISSCSLRSRITFSALASSTRSLMPRASSLSAISKTSTWLSVPTASVK